eukprot:XP_014778051.1 PREDICTED: uncharacterized protein LOC106874733 isoform X2 [Octopus bimaculoides]
MYGYFMIKILRLEMSKMTPFLCFSLFIVGAAKNITCLSKELCPESWIRFPESKNDEHHCKRTKMHIECIEKVKPSCLHFFIDTFKTFCTDISVTQPQLSSSVCISTSLSILPIYLISVWWCWNSETIERV